jgi:hypothetical protein
MFFLVMRTSQKQTHSIDLGSPSRLIADYQTKPLRGIAEQRPESSKDLMSHELTKRSQIHSANAQQFFSPPAESQEQTHSKKHRWDSTAVGRGRPPALTWSSTLLATAEKREARRTVLSRSGRGAEEDRKNKPIRRTTRSIAALPIFDASE